MSIKTFCEEECQRQKFVPGTLKFQVACRNMMVAWNVADMLSGEYMDNDIRPQDILSIGSHIEPVLANGFRQSVVSFENGSVIGWENIPSQIDSLCNHGTNLSPQEWYEEFERIHPFKDGNGRVGKILFNWLNRTLDDPEFPQAPENREK